MDAEQNGKPRYGVCKCPCGHRGCSDYHLTGIGRFVQGSGFSLAQAEHIVKLLNENPPPEEM